jgi:hypothetical protein
VRRTPNRWTSSAPKVDTPTSVTQSGRSVTAAISSSFAGHSSICQWFQSRGKPCTATTSTQSRTRSSVIVTMKPGSMGEMPPSTRVSPGRSARTAPEAAWTVRAKIRHPSSTSKSQCDLLLGSFQNLTASIIRSSQGHAT